jgi:hypothetical protein
MQGTKWEVPTTRCAQTRALLFPFSALHNRQLRSGSLSQNQRQHQCQNLALDGFGFGFGFDFDFDFAVDLEFRSGPVSL